MEEPFEESSTSFVGESDLHAPQPSYDTASQLSEEMLKLLHFPDLTSKSVSVMSDNDDAVTPAAAKELMSQFLIDDALEE